MGLCIRLATRRSHSDAGKRKPDSAGLSVLFSGFLAGKPAPERLGDPAGTSPVPDLKAGKGRVGRALLRRFGPHMFEHCADQDDQEHLVSRVE